MIASGENQAVQAQAAPVFPPELFLAEGLRPFQGALAFRLRVEADAPPFLSMTCGRVAVPGQPGRTMDLAYVLLDPFAVFPDYAPEFFESDLAGVGLAEGQAPLILAIVNFHGGFEDATANLVGPLLINPATGKARQAVLKNATRYSVRQRLLKK